jgi:tRNA(Ile)-lysidine synthase
MLESVRAEGLLREGRPVVVLLSGGRDSTCLLDLAVQIAGPDAVRALHVNYGLRAAADDDERHCTALCASLGTRLEVIHAERPERGNVQAWAREVRYGAARETAAEDGADIATGHTATDQVETILYRLASSPSRRALLGIRPHDGNLVRPLLRFTRAQTAAHCTARGLQWCEDESNVSGAYARARIRAELVPALRAVHPAAEENVLALAELLRDEAAVLDALVDEVLGGATEIELPRLRALPPALQRLIVQRLADAAVGRPAPGTARRADEIAALPDTGTSALDLPHGVRAIAERGRLRFVRRTAAVDRPPRVTHSEADPPPPGVGWGRAGRPLK